ncbi:hypothetical protein D0T84_21575, partial [Dysgonomonas sp. 521]|nr:hypothetical protein [Dysgonomonas sp. 521]
MTTNEHPNANMFILNTLSSDIFSNIKQTRKNFIFHLLMFYLGIKGKINFLQLARFSRYCEQYFRINFENIFNF